MRRTSNGAAIGSIGIRLLDGQSAAPGDPRAAVYIVDRLAPGAVIERHVEISNTTATSQHVDLYAAAATIANGSFTGAADRTPNDLSSWTALAPGGIDVSAAGRRVAVVTITVPEKAASGEQYAVVWAEARSAPTVGAGSIVQVSRVGVRIYLSVGPGGAPAGGFAIESLTATRPPHGRPLVTASVHNTGGRALDISGKLRLLHGPGGLTAGPFPANLGVTLAIGETEPVVIALDKRLPSGPWDAQITLHSGLVERSVRGTTKFPGVAVSAPASNDSGWLVPTIVALAFLLVVLTSVLVFPRRRRRGAHSIHRAIPLRTSPRRRQVTRRPGRRPPDRFRRGRRARTGTTSSSSSATSA